MSALFTRDEHLHALALERLAAGELDAASVAEAEDHLAGCARCRAAAAELDQPLAVPVGPRVPAPANRVAAGSWARAWMPLAALAAALAVVVVSRPGPDRPDLHPRGNDLTLEVFRQTDAASDALVDGAGVAEGDTLGFRVTSSAPGWLLLAGVDSTASVYPVWPAERPHAAVQDAGSGEARPLDAAATLDATPGEERLMLVRCDHAFTLADLVAGLASEEGPEVPPGCALRAVRLAKQAPP